MKAQSANDARQATLGAANDFSLVRGGLFFRFCRRTRLSGDELEGVLRRMCVLALIAWLPLLLLSMAEGRAWGDSTALTFLKDIETHVRLLIAVPLLILGELYAHKRLRRIAGGFIEHGMIPDALRPKFDAAIASAMRLRDSTLAELLLIVFVYTVGHLAARDLVSLDVNSWWGAAADGQMELSLAGWWVALVSLPLFQFLMMRWYFRLFIWARFLWQVSRMDLNLQPMHPDSAAGLGFLALSGRAFEVFLLGMGTVLAAMLANRIFYAGLQLIDFKVEIAAWVAFLTFIILGPLLLFWPALRRVRRRGILEFGPLGQRYASEFKRKWLRGDRPADEPLLGSADIQSLADLHNSFQTVEGMRLILFGWRNVIALVSCVLFPVTPLLLTLFSVEELLDRMLTLIL